MVDRLSFISDAFFGTLDEPYELSLDANGINGISGKPGEVEWHTLSGIRLAAKPTHPGIYMANGHKVIVRGYNLEHK